jgi:hypothetical protein
VKIELDQLWFVVKMPHKKGDMPIAAFIGPEAQAEARADRHAFAVCTNMLVEYKAIPASEALNEVVAA